MASLLKTYSPSLMRSSFALRAPAATIRSFQTSRILAVGKESQLHNENRPAEAEHHKQDQLQKQKEGKGHWKDELASDSESIVKADRGDVGNPKETIQELQRESAKVAEKEKGKQ